MKRRKAWARCVAEETFTPILECSQLCLRHLHTVSPVYIRMREHALPVSHTTAGVRTHANCITKVRSSEEIPLMDMCSPAEFAQSESGIVTQLLGSIRPLGYSVAHGYMPCCCLFWWKQHWAPPHGEYRPPHPAQQLDRLLVLVLSAWWKIFFEINISAYIFYNNSFFLL